MQSRTIPITLSNGTTLYIETSGGSERDVSAMSALSIDGVMNTVKAFSESLQETIASAKPRAARLEFGIAFEVKAGKLAAVLAQGGATSHVNIQLEWGEPVIDD